MLSRKLSKTLLFQIRTIHGYSRIGNRDVVGFGINGSANYSDNVHFPFPAIRFKENTREICALREKEKGDWRMLSCDEKKELYRASFCQTFAEFNHPTGQWKFCLGYAFIFTSFGFWAAIFYHYFVYEPLPPSFSKESRRAQLRRMIELHVNPVDGLTSHWDYDNDRWKAFHRFPHIWREKIGTFHVTFLLRRDYMDQGWPTIRDKIYCLPAKPRRIYQVNTS